MPCKFDRIFMPDFIGIGAAKSGTSWLWHNLRKHRDIWTPMRKELHFFDVDIRKRCLPVVPFSVEARIRYARHFIPGKILGKVTGEVTPGYGILPDDTIGLINSWMPNLKILYIMRDPVPRAWSHAKMVFPNFMNKSIEEASIDELISFFKLPSVFLRGDYVYCLKNWFKYYPREQFYICFLEEAATDPVLVIQSVFAFLEISVNAEMRWDLNTKVNVSRKTIEIPIDVRDYLETEFYNKQYYFELESLIDCELPWIT